MALTALTGLLELLGGENPLEGIVAQQPWWVTKSTVVGSEIIFDQIDIPSGQSPVDVVYQGYNVFFRGEEKEIEVGEEIKTTFVFECGNDGVRAMQAGLLEKGLKIRNFKRTEMSDGGVAYKSWIVPADPTLEAEFVAKAKEASKAGSGTIGGIPAPAVEPEKSIPAPAVEPKKEELVLS